MDEAMNGATNSRILYLTENGSKVWIATDNGFYQGRIEDVVLGESDAGLPHQLVNHIELKHMRSDNPVIRRLTSDGGYNCGIGDIRHVYPISEDTFILLLATDVQTAAEEAARTYAERIEAARATVHRADSQGSLPAAAECQEVADRWKCPAVGPEGSDPPVTREQYEAAKAILSYHESSEPNVGENIRQARVRISMTQTELANRIGVDQKQVSRWETGARIPDAYYVITISKALNVDAGRLLR